MKNKTNKSRHYLKLGILIGISLLILFNLYNFYMDYQQTYCSEFKPVNDCPTANQSISAIKSAGEMALYTQNSAVICARSCTSHEALSQAVYTFKQDFMKSLALCFLVLLFPVLIGYLADIYKKRGKHEKQ